MKMETLFTPDRDFFISINEFSHFYVSNSVPYPTEGEQGSSLMDLSCWLQLSHDSR